ncbi:MAG: hypothetical protein KDJ26_03840 [Alphaproteobacteria bacterium]|jgi:hypothetical protein|nr:hypothetical protein [Alphaproteobacteria bacterium]MCB1551115.1 hypothetical protein [Alphaproteobacteria bacterium]MCB9985020.1 hypothetical protein [Micavibrio sp.]HRK97410.1 hypothetical protein [Alphaproteobacteria bacterium]
MNIKYSVLAILLSAMITSSSASAQTPITTEMTQKYYEQCLVNSKTEGTMTDQSRQTYCACTAENMKKNMVIEDLQAMQGQDQAARDAINKVLIDVNGPCMHVPLHDKVYTKCMTDVNKTSICQCLSKGISEYLSKQSQTLLKDILAKNPNIYDPMGALMDTQEYKTTEKRIALSCATGSAY